MKQKLIFEISLQLPYFLHKGIHFIGKINFAEKKGCSDKFLIVLDILSYFRS